MIVKFLCKIYLRKMKINQILETVKRRPFEKGLSFHEAVSPVLKLARIFSLIPIKGVNGITSSTLYFEYYSWQILYSVITTSIIGMMIGLILFWMIETPINFGKIGKKLNKKNYRKLNDFFCFQLFSYFMDQISQLLSFL